MNSRENFYGCLTILGVFAAGVLIQNGHLLPTDLGRPDATPSTPSAPEPRDDTYRGAELVEAHNQERARHKLAPLAASEALGEAARKHAEHMAARGKMAHGGIGDGALPDRVKDVGYHYTSAGENVAWNYADVAAAMAGWMHSPGHRANILGNYREMGAAVAFGRDGSPYWCTVFASPVR